MKLEIELPDEADELLNELEEQAPLAREQVKNKLRGRAMELISSRYQQLQQQRQQQEM